MTTQILQLTDLHLMADPDAVLKGICTRGALGRVLEFVREGEAAGEWDFEQVVLTGDLAHDERLETYQALAEMLAPWWERCRIVPGNHDDRDCIRAVFGERLADDCVGVNFSTDAGHWRWIGLDSHLPGEVAGRIDQDQFRWLAEQLASGPERPTALFVHHPPLSVDSPWLDAIGLQGADRLRRVVEEFPQVRLVCCGHVHQEFAAAFGGAEMLTSPSTAVQFLPRTEGLVIDERPPGFRVLRLHEDSYETEVVRLPGE